MQHEETKSPEEIFIPLWTDYPYLDSTADYNIKYGL